MPNAIVRASATALPKDLDHSAQAAQFETDTVLKEQYEPRTFTHPKTGRETSLPRRGFLRQLCGLPFIGGGLTLIGAPTAIAEPVTDDLLWGYKSWLHYEHRMLSYELADYDPAQAKEIERFQLLDNAASDWHFTMIGDDWGTAPQPSTRAALVLSAVGCNWRG